jgi:hypothetical protein
MLRAYMALAMFTGHAGSHYCTVITKFWSWDYNYQQDIYWNEQYKEIMH